MLIIIIRIKWILLINMDINSPIVNAAIIGLIINPNIFTNLNLTDMEVGFKAFKTEILRKLTLRENRFGFEPEFTMKIAKRKFKIYEVPISYSGRDYSEGKKITWVDGVKALGCLVYFRFFE